MARRASYLCPILWYHDAHEEVLREPNDKRQRCVCSALKAHTREEYDSISTADQPAADCATCQRIMIAVLLGHRLDPTPAR
jgi:hypothetical protein